MKTVWFILSRIGVGALGMGFLAGFFLLVLAVPQVTLGVIVAGVAFVIGVILLDGVGGL